MSDQSTISQGPPVLDHVHDLQQVGNETANDGTVSAIWHCQTFKTYTAGDGEVLTILQCGYGELRPATVASEEFDRQRNISTLKAALADLEAQS